MKDDSRFIFIFLDGVGLNDGVETNPFAAAACRYLPFHMPEPLLPDGTPVTPLDARLGVEGIPQSASGQGTLYTGINIPARWGHRGSYPGLALRKLLYRDNLIKNLMDMGLTAGFLNAYPHYAPVFQPPHLELMPDGTFRFSSDFPRRFQRRLSTTTCMMLSSGLKPRDERDIVRGDALYQDFSNESLIRLGLDVPEFTPEQAAGIIADTALSHDFLLYEFFQTDLYAHRRKFHECVELAARLDRLVGLLIERMDPARDTLVITSDHGNMEDCSSSSHTLNPVPLVAWGRLGPELRTRIHSLADVTPTLLSILKPSCGRGTMDSPSQRL